MNRRSKTFLINILGPDGYKILAKAANTFPEISSVIMPKALLAWLEVAQAAQYEGDVPGLEGSFASLSKSEIKVSVDSGVYTLGGERSDLATLTGILLVNLGESGIAPQVDLSEATKLSKSLELLVKSKTAAWIASESESKESEKSESSSEESSEVELEKGGMELPGKAAAPRAALEPQSPTPPGTTKANPTSPKVQRAGVMGQPKLPKLPMQTKVFKKSELQQQCRECGKGKLHPRWGTVIGCDCTAPLVKSEGLEVIFDYDTQSYSVTGDSELVNMLGESNE